MNPRRALVALIGVVVLAGCGSGGARVRIAVNHPVALWDMPLRIVVSRLKPDEHTMLRATTGDWFGSRYASSTRVTASSAGRIELSGDAALRPLWSLRQVGRVTGGGQTSPSALTVTLSVAGARTKIHRLLAASGVHGSPIRHPFYGEYYAPATTSTRRPAILVFGGSEGGLSTTEIADLYASHGYPSLALAYFAEPGLPLNLRRVPLEYFARALSWLRRQPGVDPAKLAVEGISRGSEAAQLVGIHYPRLVQAVIAMVPSNGAVCGITRFNGTSGVRCIGAAWTFHGKAIPYEPAGSQYTIYPFPDGRIDGPIFLDCAGDDHLWPSCPMAQAIVHRLHAHHFQHTVTLLAYPHAGHGVASLHPNQIYYSGLLGGLYPDSNDRAAATGWPKLLGFLRSFARS
jgi:dienelactone hydrolase